MARLRDKPIRLVAKDLGISESCLRNWLARADADDGRRDGRTSEERKELAALRKEKWRLEVENEILRRRRRISPGRTSSQMIYPVVACLAAEGIAAGVRYGRRRVERLMRAAGLQGVLTVAAVGQGVLVEAGGHGAPVFEPVEAAFDGVALPV